MDDDELVQRRESMPIQVRGAAVQTVNEEARTVDVVFSTGASVQRYNWRAGGWYDEELEISTSAIRMERLNSGAPVLDAHSQWDMRSQIGVVERAWVENGVGMATLRFSQRPEADAVFRDVVDGIARNVSVGYVAHRYDVEKRGEGERERWIARDWEPYEISMVPVPADAGAQVRSGGEQSGGDRRTFDCEIFEAGQAGNPTADTRSNSMPNEDDVIVPASQNTPATESQRTAPATQPVDADAIRQEAIAAERARQSTIRGNVRGAGLDEAFADDLIGRGVSVADANAAIVQRISALHAEGGTERSARVETVRDEGETMVRGIEGAIMHRLAPSRDGLDDNARRFRGMGLLRMAEEVLRARGVNVAGLSRLELAGRALHSTSDFPLLLQNVAGKRLRMAYEENVPSYTMWARRASNAPDFKSITVAQLGGMPALVKVPTESGEFTYGTIGEGAETYQVATYGRIVGLNRQSIINDDLSAFDRIIPGFASAARRLENQLVYAQLTSNPTMADGTALFHADHGNLLTGGGSALAVAGLTAARTAMRKQTGLAGEILNISPSFLIVPAALEQTAYTLTSANYVPAKTSDINEFRAGGRTALEPIVEAELDATSTAHWFLAARPGVIDTVEYCYLDGAEGVFIDSEMGFDVDGLKIKARLDFAAKVIDHRGLNRSNGS